MTVGARAGETPLPALRALCWAVLVTALAAVLLSARGPARALDDREAAGVRNPRPGESLPSPASTPDAPDMADAEILVYSDDLALPSGSTYPEQALSNLGLAFTMFYNDPGGFEAALGRSDVEWDLVVVDAPEREKDWTALTEYVKAGGRAVVSTWSPPELLLNAFDANRATSYTTPLDVHHWTREHRVFNSPNPLPDPLVPSDSEFTDNGDRLDTLDAAQALAGFAESPGSDGEAAMVLGNGGRTLYNGFLLADFDDPGDRPLAVRLWENEISALLGGLEGPCEVAADPGEIIAGAHPGDTAERKLRLRNTGFGPCDVSVEEASSGGGGGVPWLSFPDDAPSTLEGGASADVFLEFDSAGLPAGRHTGALRVTWEDAHEAGPADVQKIPVEFTVRPPLDPPQITADLPTGFTATEGTAAFIPGSPELPVDIYFLTDLSGTFEEDLPLFQEAAPAIIGGLRDAGLDAHFGAGYFMDYPIDPWGDAAEDSLDAAYDRASAIVPPGQDTDGNGRSDILDAIHGLPVGWGNDPRESQLTALYQSVTGAGKDLSAQGFPEASISPGLEAGFRPGAMPIVILWTDYSFHRPGDSGPFPYPGPGFDQVIEAYNDRGVKVIGIAGGDGGRDDLETVAKGVGMLAPPGGVDCDGDGSADVPEGNPFVCDISADGDGIADAILNGVERATAFGDIALRPEDNPSTPFDERELVEEVAPPVFEDMNLARNTSLDFSVTYTCPPGAPAGEHHLRLSLTVGGSVLAEPDAFIACHPLPIAFSSDRHGSDDIFRMGPGGAMQRRVTSGDASERRPAWSPGMDRIAYDSDEPGNRDIFSVSPDGSEPRNLTGHPAEDTDPEWLPKQREVGESGTSTPEILFASDRDGDSEIYGMRSDGSGQRNLTNSPEAGDRAPAAAPDGSSVLFTRRMQNGNTDIWKMRPDGSRQANLTNTPEVSEDHAAFLADGSGILFELDRDGNPEIWRMDPDGSGRTQVTSGGTSTANGAPAPGPDMESFAFHSDRSGAMDVWRYDVATSSAVNISARPSGLDREPDWALPPGFCPGPDIETSPYGFSAVAEQGQSRAVGTLDIGNTGCASLSWEITQTPEAPWLSLSRTQGTLDPGESAAPVITVDAAGLGPGVYSIELELRSNDPDSPMLSIPVSVQAGGLDPTPVEPMGCVANPRGGPEGWRALADLPVGREGGFAVAINDRVFAGQGESSAFGEDAFHYAYHIPSDRWLTAAPAPVSRANVTAVCGEEDGQGKVFVFGGRSDGGVLDDLHVYDPIGDSWSARSPMPTPRAAMGAAYVPSEGEIYVIGGRDAPTRDGGAPLAAVEAYDIAAGTWSEKATLPLPVMDNPSTVYDPDSGNIYVIGGFDGTAATGAVQIYDVVDDSWSMGAPMPTPRSSVLAGFCGGRIHVIGGFDGTNQLAVNEAYDPDSETWSAGWAPLPEPRSAFMTQGVSTGQDIHAIGGGRGTGLARHDAYQCEMDQETVESHAFGESRLNLTVSAPDGGEQRFTLTGPSAWDVFFEGPQEGDAADDDGNGLDEVEAELAELSMAGETLDGPVELQLSDEKASRGVLEEQEDAEAGRLDVPPFAEVDRKADGHFHLHTEITLPGGPVLHPEDPVRLSGDLSHIPPAPGERMAGEPGVDLLAEGGEPSGYRLVSAEYTPSPIPEATVAAGQADLPSGGSGTVPVAIENVAVPQGLGSYSLTVHFDPSVIHITGVAGGDPPFESVTDVSVDNEAGTVSFSGSHSESPGPTGDQAVASLSAQARGDVGECSPLEIDLDGEALQDADGGTIPASGADGRICVPGTRASPLLRLHQDSDDYLPGLDWETEQDGAVGLIVGVDDVVDGGGASVDVALRSYDAELRYDAGCVSVLEVRDGRDMRVLARSIDDDQGVANFNGQTLAGASPDTLMAFIVLRMTGSADRECPVELELTELSDVDGNQVRVDRDANPVRISVRRGNIRQDNRVDIADALFGAQYLAGLREGCRAPKPHDGDGATDCADPVGMASVKTDGGHDEADIADVLFIAQMLAGLRDGLYQIP